MIDLVKAEKFAIDTAKRAGKLIIENKERIEITKVKDKQDFCTNVDLKAEELIIKEIKKVYPDHSIISEEIGNIDKKSNYVWIIDPLDGTKNFMRNLPIFSVSIALQFKKEIVVGVVHDPSTKMTFHAIKDGGAYLDGHNIKVSKTKRLDHTFVYLDVAKMYHLKEKETKTALKRLNDFITSVYRIRSFGSGALALCYLAQGSYDVYFDLSSHTKHVDIAAASVIVTEAGGTFTNDKGDSITSHDEHFLATNSHLEKQVLELLKN